MEVSWYNEALQYKLQLPISLDDFVGESWKMTSFYIMLVDNMNSPSIMAVKFNGGRLG